MSVDLKINTNTGGHNNIDKNSNNSKTTTTTNNNNDNIRPLVRCFMLVLFLFFYICVSFDSCTSTLHS